MFKISEQMNEYECAGILALLDKPVMHRHNKTGNIYSKYGVVTHGARVKDGSPEPSFIALCCENMDVSVKLYYNGGVFYYVLDENPNLHEKHLDKVLYARNGVFWLRSVADFTKPVELNGEVVPRFEKVDFSLKS